jgi:hypothetical protein
VKITIRDEDDRLLEEFDASSEQEMYELLKSRGIELVSPMCLTPFTWEAARKKED